EFPDWLPRETKQLTKLTRHIAQDFDELEVQNVKDSQQASAWHEVGDIFEIEYGHSYELCHMSESPDGINFVSRRSGNNGVSAKVSATTEEPSRAGSLTVALGGNVLETYVQPAPFYSGRDIAILWPKYPMPIEHKLFYALAIKANR